MIDSKAESEHALSPWVVLVIAVVAAGLVLVRSTGGALGAALAAMTALVDGGLAVIVFVAAGGYGALVLRKIAPAGAPAGLRIATACGLGLWGLSTLMLIVGSVASGLLTIWVWWPVTAGGVLLAAWQLRDRTPRMSWPNRVHGRALIWVLIAVAIAIWISGVTRPPGLVGAGPDEYDVLEYHLQVPREYYDAGRITPLRHNVYSFFPGGVEMLSLLCMCLRGGVYAGVYAAKFIHGLFAVLAVVAVATTLKDKDALRGRYAGVLLATAPFVLYLGWLGMVELAQICYLTLALLWLRQWIADRDGRSAWWVGGAAGMACATKYLAVGFVAAPVTAAMVLAALLTRDRPGKLAHIGGAALAMLVFFSPWLIRNTAATGNPVFPLATSTFGRGHWSAESQQRWVDGHGPDKRPPVPTPAGWTMPPQPTRPSRFFRSFLSFQMFGPLLLAMAAMAVCVLVALRGPPDLWDWMLVIVGGVQLTVWTLWTHEMPSRFIVPVIVPAALLAGGVLERLSRVRHNPMRRRDGEGPGAWGAVVAGVLLVIIAGQNLFIGFRVHAATNEFLRRQGIPAAINGTDVKTLAAAKREAWFGPDAEARVMLVGHPLAFYMPAGSVYATAFDAHPLAEMIEQGRSPRQMLDDLQGRGVTHILINWDEIIRLAHTYGFPPSLAAEPLAAYDRQWPHGQWIDWPALGALADLVPLGARELEAPQADEAPGRYVRPTIYVLPPTATTAPAEGP
ncbi:hypothetical protein LCGC14_0238860 [marine sediment metagenome]|uniref:Uncharacterized protein n=1 Tax=marine sediment metagenome TaxID=412755 RepID=A0A0F9UCK3_9ZZZZ|nr:hypothetical protein [Phycisphaerae bacterium]HDZ43768.1 hypothetical protein [Phycisphaerae bacterium]